MNNIKDTIFALASGKGKAGVAVIRISGARSSEALKALGFTDKPSPRKAVFKKLKNINTDEILDESLVTWFPAPHSFTGEDTVELNLHGSQAVISEMLHYLSGIPGFRMAEAGEFSKMAFTNGKLDLTQIEGLADLIDAETKAQARQALKLLDGEIGRQYEKWRAEMLEIQAFTEAYIDFPDEDIPTDLDLRFSGMTERLVTSLNSLLQNRSGERIRNGVIATIIGQPNVGKSSLLNLLAKRELAIVSDIAGTTRDSIECNLDINGYPLTIIDTAGIRESTDRIEQEGVKRALAKAEKADIKIVMLDAAQHPQYNKEIIKFIDENTIILINKTDTCKPDEDIIINDYKTVKISITAQTGLDEFYESLQTMTARFFNENEGTLSVTHSRHRMQIEEACLHLKNFIEARKVKLPIELCAEEIRYAANAIGKITGKIDVEELLGKIFSSFCIGK